MRARLSGTPETTKTNANPMANSSECPDRGFRESMAGSFHRRHPQPSVTRKTGKNNYLLDGFSRSQDKLESWNERFAKESELPTMHSSECPYEVLAKRIRARSKFSGRNDDNIESMQWRFDVFKVENRPVVELFLGETKGVGIDPSPSLQVVFPLMESGPAELTENDVVTTPPTERAALLNAHCNSSDPFFASFLRTDFVSCPQVSAILGAWACLDRRRLSTN